MAPTLEWLPLRDGVAAQLRAVERAGIPEWPALVGIAGSRLDFLATERLGRIMARSFEQPPEEIGTVPVRLAILGSATTTHLPRSIMVGAARRNLFVSTYEGGYGQYHSALLGADAMLDDFAPTAILLALDARHLASVMAPLEGEAAVDAGLDHLRECWAAARERFGGTVIQQTLLPVFPELLGSNEHRLPGSPAWLIARINARLREAADTAGVQLLAIDTRAAHDGLTSWYDPALWFRNKHEVSPAAAPFYGDMVGRLLAAAQGRSRKCLVLDLDNTLWGGVIGDDGAAALALGQGHAEGEAFLAIQDHVRQLSRRGVILAVCSKNDEAVAAGMFDTHPEMLLRRTDIAAFVANWDDKPANLRRIAAELNIGLDALVFLDDNPFERNLVREALPMVAVPEIPDDDPSRVPQILASAGYFEGLFVTSDDRSRAVQYQQNRARDQQKATATDLPSYLAGLDMQLVWQRFNETTLPRTVQLINKTNQFNLTTERTTEQAVREVIADPDRFGLTLRLIDRFGDNGIVAAVIGRTTAAGECILDTWVMSCRVLGRGIERATIGLAAAEAERLGANRLVGRFVPSGRNEMVRALYSDNGFAGGTDLAEGLFVQDIATWETGPVPLRIIEGAS